MPGAEVMRVIPSLASAPSQDRTGINGSKLAELQHQQQQQH